MSHFHTGRRHAAATCIHAVHVTIPTQLPHSIKPVNHPYLVKCYTNAVGEEKHVQPPSAPSILLADAPPPIKHEEAGYSADAEGSDLNRMLQKAFELLKEEAAAAPSRRS